MISGKQTLAVRAAIFFRTASARPTADRRPQSARPTTWSRPDPLPVFGANPAFPRSAMGPQPRARTASVRLKCVLGKVDKVSTAPL